MLTEKRHQIIINLLEEKGIVKLLDLMQSTDSSESTIRRDLTFLEAQGILRRVHGGAKLVENKTKEPTYKEKTFKNVQSKKDIAKYASLFIEDNDTVFLDAGTSTYEIIPYLKEKSVFVVTNGLNHIDALIENNIDCYMLGGKIKSTTKAVTGSDAIKSLNKFYFDKAFLGTNGIDKDMGFTTPDTDEAILKELAVKKSKRAFILADHSKFNSKTLVKFAELDEAIIITDSKSNIEDIKDSTEIKVAE